MQLKQLEVGTVFLDKGHSLILSSPVDMGIEVVDTKGKFSYQSYSLYPDSEVQVISTPDENALHVPLPSRARITTSCDPEFFLRDPQGNLVPGYAVLADKAIPTNVTHGIVHEDGFQGELSPKNDICHERVINRLGYTMFAMSALASGYASEVKNYYTSLHTLNRSVQIAAEIFIEVPPELLKSASKKHVSLGCDPSENIYNTPSFAVDNPRTFPYRMAGGHIHLGTPAIASFLHARAENIIRSMDTFLGVASVALFDEVDDPRRRKFYGRAGEFRYQKHGLEYRTLSSVWTWHPGVAHIILNLARGSFRYGIHGFQYFSKTIDPEQVREIVDTHDVNSARAFIKKHRSLFAHILCQDSGKGWSETAIEMMNSGVLAAIPHYRRIDFNWQRLTRNFSQYAPAIKKAYAARALAARALAAESQVVTPKRVVRDANGRFARAA